VTPKLREIFADVCSELRPRSPLPDFEIRFYPFTNLNNTIRLREGRVYVRLSDLLEGAPRTVLYAILHILVAKLYRKSIDPGHAALYRRFAGSRSLSSRTHLIRQMRGRKRVPGPQGTCYNLDEVFETLNARFFNGLMGRPQMTWSTGHARQSLGHYDPAHNTIVISRIFDDPRVPRFAVEYLVYHEMLHLRHPVKLRGTRRCVHSAAFQQEERLFPQLEDARKFLKRI